MVLEIKPCNCNTDPFASQIINFMSRGFPGSNSGNKESVLDNVMQAIIASGQIRFGPAPSVESLFYMRDVVRYRISRDEPIPFVTPWGSKKPNNGSVDMAEVCGLKTIRCLNERIKSFYTPGINVNIRMEDVNGFYVFREEGPEAIESSKQYVSDFSKLIRVLNFDGFINPVLESSLMSQEDYFRIADNFLPSILEYLNESEGMSPEDAVKLISYKTLLQNGWKGTVPQEQRDYYKARYAVQYPGMSPEKQQFTLAQYFASSIARYKLDALGNDKAWEDKYLWLSFVPPVPGSPESLTSKRVYYRTIPSNMTRNHMMPWRSKGYLRVSETEVKPAQASFHEKQDYNSFSTILSNRNESIEVQCDYVII